MGSNRDKINRLCGIFDHITILRRFYSVVNKLKKLVRNRQKPKGHKILQFLNARKNKKLYIKKNLPKYMLFGLAINNSQNQVNNKFQFNKIL